MDHLLLHCKYAYVLWSEFFFDVWDPVGDAKDSNVPYFWMEELARETFFKYLEYGSCLSYLVNLAGM